MQIVIDIPDAPIKDYQDLFYKIDGMAASEGLYDDKVKSQRALALKVVLDILDGIVNGTPLPKVIEDIKSEIRSIQPKWHENAGKHNCIDEVIKIIDRNISRKEPVGNADKLDNHINGKETE